TSKVGVWPRVVKALEWGLGIRRFVKRLRSPGKVDVVIYSNVWVDGLCHPKSVPYAVRMDTPLCTVRNVPGCADQFAWRAYEFLERTTARRANAVICLTNEAAAKVQKEYGIESNKLVILSNPIDTDRFRPVASRTQLAPRIFHPGPRLSDWQKGTQVLLQAMEEVVLRFPSAQLVLAGIGKPDFSAASDRVTQSVQLLGWLDPEQLAQHYALADVTVVPSLNYDSFPSVCLESLAAGTPVIGTSVGGIPEIIQHLETGMIVPPGEPGEL